MLIDFIILKMVSVLVETIGEFFVFYTSRVKEVSIASEGTEDGTVCSLGSKESKL